MSDSSSTKWVFAKEVTYGVNPAGTPDTLRITGDSLEGTFASIQSEEIVSERMIADIIRTGKGIRGGFNFELTGATFDSFICGALCTSVSGGFTPASDLTGGTSDIDVTAVSPNDATATQFLGPAGFLAAGASFGGAIYYFAGYTGGAIAENNGWWMLKKRTASTTTGDFVGTGVDRTAAAGINVTRPDWVTTDSTLWSWTIERQHTDIPSSTTDFHQFKGLAVESLTINLELGRMATGSIAFIGSALTNSATSSFGAANASNANTILNNVDHIPFITMGSHGGRVATTLVQERMPEVKSLSFTIRPNPRVREEIGTLGAVGMGLGTEVIEGRASVYYGAGAEASYLLTNYNNWTDIPIGFVVAADTSTASATGYTFGFPSCKITSLKTTAGGINQDVLIDFTFQARRQGPLASITPASGEIWIGKINRALVT